MKHIIILLLFSIFTLSSYGQSETITSRNSSADGRIYGFVYEKNSKTPMEFANVVIYNQKDSTIVSGGITDEKGYFNVDGLRYGNYYIEIIFIGYGEQLLTDITISADKKTVDLKKIYLSVDAQLLGEVSVEAQINDVEYKLDKKVINVNSDIVSAGASAVEVLENVPSVTTDIDGNVSLRGTESFLVLIDGRPSPLQGSEALQQIPASSIERMEIITNPSAKYEAEGAGGIINVILKKERRRGYNGQISANYGSFNSFGANALFNFRTEKFNFFVGGDYSLRKSEGLGESRRETYINPDTTYFLFNDSKNNGGGNHGNIRFGLDYFLTDNDVFTISGRYGQHGRDRTGNTTVRSFYEDFGSNRYDSYNYFSENLSKSKNHNFSGDINYAKKFRKDGHELQAFLSYSQNSSGETSEYSEQKTNNNGELVGDEIKKNRTKTDNTGKVVTAKIDYVLPLFEQGKLEAGWQMRNSADDSDYRYQTLLVDEWEDDPNKLNPYTFSNHIQSGYAIFSNFYKKLGYQVGLRTEYTNRVFHQTVTDQKWPHNQFDFFPSVHLSYQLPADMELMASYSRRFQRPRNHYLDPFEEVIDPNNIRKGNPELMPQYTNSYDLNFQKRFKTHFVSLEAYVRQTNNKIERINVIEEDNPNINIATFDNVGKDLSLGTEIMANLNLFKWWNFNLSGNVFYYEIISDKYQDNNTVTWRVRLNNTFRIRKTETVIQFGGNYTGPSITSQGKSYGRFMANFGVRQDFLDRKLSVSVNLRDIFGTGKWINETSTDLFYSYSENKRKSPTFTISATYKINDFKVRKEKGDAVDYGDDEIF